MLYETALELSGINRIRLICYVIVGPGNRIVNMISLQQTKVHCLPYYRSPVKLCK